MARAVIGKIATGELEDEREELSSRRRPTWERRREEARGEHDAGTASGNR